MANTVMNEFHFFTTKNTENTKFFFVGFVTFVVQLIRCKSTNHCHYARSLECNYAYQGSGTPSRSLAAMAFCCSISP